MAPDPNSQQAPAEASSSTSTTSSGPADVVAPDAKAHSAPETLVDPGIATLFHDGLLGGAAGAAIAILALLFGGLLAHLEPSTQTATAIRIFILGVGLGPPFAWISHKVRLPVVPAAVVYAGAFTLGAEGFSPRALLVAIVYGLTLGLVLRFRRSADAASS